MVKLMSERKWYGSSEHFNTEKSYEEYKKSKRKVQKKNKIRIF